MGEAKRRKRLDPFWGVAKPRSRKPPKAGGKPPKFDENTRILLTSKPTPDELFVLRDAISPEVRDEFFRLVNAEMLDPLRGQFEAVELPEAWPWKMKQSAYFILSMDAALELQVLLKAAPDGFFGTVFTNLCKALSLAEEPEWEAAE